MELLDARGEHVCWGVCKGDRLYTARHCARPARMAELEGRDIGDDLLEVDGACSRDGVRTPDDARLDVSDLQADIVVGFDAGCRFTRGDVVLDGSTMLIPHDRCPLERGASGLLVRARREADRRPASAEVLDFYLISRRRSTGSREVLVAVKCEACAVDRPLAAGSKLIAGHGIELALAGVCGAVLLAALVVTRARNQAAGRQTT